MTETATPATDKGLIQGLRELETWKKVLLGASVFLILAGLALSLAEDSPRGVPNEIGGPSVQPSGAAGALIDPGQAPGPGSAGQTGTPADAPWSAGFFRLGFSFFAGFCVGYAARTTFKLIAVGCGFAFLFLFVLSYVGLITVDWVGFDRAFEKMAERIAAEAGNFRTFITGSLPATGLATLGLYAGFKRK